MHIKKEKFEPKLDEWAESWLKGCPKIQILIDFFKRLDYKEMPNSRHLAQEIIKEFSKKQRFDYGELEKISGIIDVPIFYDWDKAWEAYVFGNDNFHYSYISLNPHTPKAYQTMCLAHELSHFFLPALYLASGIFLDNTSRKIFKTGSGGVQKYVKNLGHYLGHRQDDYIERLSHNLIFPDSVVEKLKLDNLEMKDILNIPKQFDIPYLTLVSKLDKQVTKYSLIYFDNASYNGEGCENINFHLQASPCQYRFGHNFKYLWPKKVGFKNVCRIADYIKEGEIVKIEEHPIMFKVQDDGWKKVRLNADCEYTCFYEGGGYKQPSIPGRKNLLVKVSLPEQSFTL